MRSVVLGCLMRLAASAWWLAVPAWWLAAPAWAVTDCSRARTAVEKMMCSSPRAARADQRLALAFRSAFGRAADRDALLADQQRWQVQVRDLCVDVDCLLRTIDERIADLEDWR